MIGIAMTSSDAQEIFNITDAIPEDINFAVKSAYIKTLLSMLPDSESELVQPKDESIQAKSFIERAKNNIVLIEAK